MKIAAAQLACVLGDVAANLAKIREFAHRAKESGAEMLVFPEMSDTGYAMRVIREQAGSWNDGAVAELQGLARKLSLTIISGVSEKEGARIYNTQVVVGSDGSILGKYRKIHLFAPAPIEEDKCCASGSSLTSISLGGFRLGLSICYDLRFPEIYRALAIEGEVNLFVVSSAWPFPRVSHLRVLATARAIENQSYLVLANRVGTDDGVQFCGSSAVIDPGGLILASGSEDEEELLLAEISIEAVKTVRLAMPVFLHRKPELYQSQGE
jgi:predicted amidohydrolase